jgi:phosphoglycerate dehydrogenase-like enzyme
VRRLGVTLATLGDVFACADVVAHQTPYLAGTAHLIGGEHLASMKPGATFISTSHGDVVDEEALVAIAARRPDPQFVLDVTLTMPLPDSSRLSTLPNVPLTPHIPGPCGRECRRLGRAMVDEPRRYVTGRPLQRRVRPPSGRHTSHESAVGLPVRSFGDFAIRAAADPGLRP